MFSEQGNLKIRTTWWTRLLICKEKKYYDSLLCRYKKIFYHVKCFWNIVFMSWWWWDKVIVFVLSMDLVAWVYIFRCVSISRTRCVNHLSLLTKIANIEKFLNNSKFPEFLCKCMLVFRMISTIEWYAQIDMHIKMLCTYE